MGRCRDYPGRLGLTAGGGARVESVAIPPAFWHERSPLGGRVRALSFARMGARGYSRGPIPEPCHCHGLSV